MSYAPSKRDFSYSLNIDFEPAIDGTDPTAEDASDIKRPAFDPAEAQQATGRILSFRQNARSAAGATTSPRLLGDENGDEDDLDVPRILLRGNGFAEAGELDILSKDEPESRDAKPASKRRYNWTSPDQSRLRPGFGGLAAAALAVAFAGGGAAALVFDQRINPQTTESRLVETTSLPAATELSNLKPFEETPGLAAEDLNARFEASLSANAGAGELSTAKDKLVSALTNAGRTLRADTSVPAGSVPVTQPVADLAPSERIAADFPDDTPATSANALPEPQAVQERPLPTAVSNTGPARVISIIEETPLPEATASKDAPEASPTGTPDIAMAQPADDFSSEGLVIAAVNLRAAKSKDAEILTVIPQDATVNHGECGKWWCAVSYEGQSGFVGRNFLQTASNP